MSSLPKAGETRQQWIDLLEEAARGRTEGLEKLLGARPDTHAPLLQFLTHLEFSPQVAQEHWRNIFENRRLLTDKLGRAASLQLAALDYFQNQTPGLGNSKILEMSTFLAIERNAITDRLTGLYNRHFFDVSLRRELKRARRYGLALSIVLLDLDDFKSINDVYGHLIGDQALSTCSTVVQAGVREIDVACRYGGEEFALILPETSRTGAFIVSERIRADVKDMFDRKQVGTSHISLTLSGGIAIYPVDSNSAEGLIRMADQALYRSKHDGKNRITLHAEEKRRSPRLDARKPLIFRARRARLAQPSELRSQTKNLSRNGALVQSHIPLDVGTELEIGIDIPHNGDSFFLKGKVVRLETTPTEAGQSAHYEVGVAFDADTEEEARKLEVLAAEIYRAIDLHGAAAPTLDSVRSAEDNSLLG